MQPTIGAHFLLLATLASDNECLQEAQRDMKKMTDVTPKKKKQQDKRRPSGKKRGVKYPAKDKLSCKKKLIFETPEKKKASVDDNSEDVEETPGPCGQELDSGSEDMDIFCDRFRRRRCHAAVKGKLDSSDVLDRSPDPEDQPQTKDDQHETQLETQEEEDEEEEEEAEAADEATDEPDKKDPHDKSGAAAEKSKLAALPFDLTELLPSNLNP